MQLEVNMHRFGKKAIGKENKSMQTAGRDIRGSKLEKSRARRRGQAIIEFALVIPVLLAVLIGIMEFGYLVKTNMTMASAAREAARYAALGKPTSEIYARVTKYAGALKLTAPTGSITLQQCDERGANCAAWPADSGGRNGVKPPSMVRVILTTKHQSLTGFIPGLQNRQLTAMVTMRREA